MFIKKEKYQEFEKEDLIWMGIFEKAEAAGTESEDNKKPEEKKTPEELEEERQEEAEKKREEAEDISEAIHQDWKTATDKINRGKTAYKENKTAEQFFTALQEHADKRFQKIVDAYQKKRKDVGAEPFDASASNPESDAGKLVIKAKNLRVSIEGRIGKAETYIEHQKEQSAINEAQREGDETKERELKIGIIEDYLANAEDTNEMHPTLRRSLAEFIVDGNLVSVEYGDMTAKEYRGNLTEFFKRVDQFNERIRSQLEGKLEKVVQMFLEEAPNTEATTDEINVFKGLINSNKELKEHYGNSEYFEKVTKVLAKKYDIHFRRNGEVAYAVDLTARPKVMTYNAKNFKTHVLSELDPQAAKASELTKSSTVDSFTEHVDKYTEDFQKMRDEIEKGLTMYRGGGKIDSWDDWEGHASATKLAKLTSSIQGKGREIEDGYRREKIAEHDVKQAKRAKEAFNRTVKEAGLGTQIKKLKEADYKQEDEKQEGFEVTETFANDEFRIRVHLNKDGEISVRITSLKEKEYSIEKKFGSAESFKKFYEEHKGLAEHAKEVGERLEDKNDKISAINDSIIETNKKLEGTGIEIKFTAPENYDERAKESFRIPDSIITMDGQVVGVLDYSKIISTDMTKEKKLKPTTAMNIKLNDSSIKPSEAFTLKDLPKKLREGQKQMKEIAEQAKKTQGEINEQRETDFQKLENYEGLKINKVEPIEGNFNDPKENIQVAEFHRTDKKLATTLSMVVGAKDQEAGKRTYILKVNSEEIPFENIDGVNTYMKEHQAELAKVPEPKKEPEALKKGREGAREAISTIVMQIYGGKLKGISPDDPQFQRAITTFVNGLKPERVNDYNKASKEKKVVISTEEQEQLKQALLDAYEFNTLEEVDSKELQTIAGIPVEREGGSTTLGRIFKGAAIGHILSRKCEFRETEGVVEVKIAGEGSEFGKVENAHDLAQYLPERMRDDFHRALKGEEVDLDGFEKTAEGELDTMEAMQRLEELIHSPEGRKAFENMSIGEMISAILEMIAMMQEASKTGDTESITEAIEDITQGRNPMERANEAKAVYEETIKNIDDPATLIALHRDPRGAEADKLFKGQPYRSQIRKIVEERFEKALDIDIEEIKSETSKGATFVAFKGTEKYHIHITSENGKTYVAMDQIKNRDDEDSTEYSDEVKEKTEVNSLEDSYNSMASVLFEMSSGFGQEEGTESYGENAEKPKVSGVVEKYAEEKDGKITLKDVKDAKIQDIFDDTVTEATIIRREKESQGIKPGDKVVVKKSGNTFKLPNGQRLYIYEGDEIVDTKTKEESKDKKE